MSSVPAAVREREARALKALFEQRVTETRKDFAKKWGLSSAAMVYQHLEGLRPLSLVAAAKFAAGIGCTLRDFSPRLAGELDNVLDLLRPWLKPIVPIGTTNGDAVLAREPGGLYRLAWPFPRLDVGRINDLEEAERLQLEGALLLVAAQMNVEIRKDLAA